MVSTGSCSADTASPVDEAAVSEISEPTATPQPAEATAAEPQSTPVAAPPEQQWISIEEGHFVDRRTDDTFVLRGVNLLRKQAGRGDVLFLDYDPEWLDQQLDEIAGHGFNTIRFFLDLCMSCAASSDGVRPEFLDNLADLLTRMADRGLVALPTSNDIPDPGYTERMPCCEVFGGYRNSVYLSAEGHAIAAEYFTDLLSGLRERGAPLHAVLAWQLANEQFFLRDVPPLSLTTGSVTTADGETYDLADDAAVEQMVASNLLAYVSSVGDAVRREHDGALVTIGYFSAEDPDAGRVASDNRWVLPEVVLRNSDLDFVDLHAYPALGATWPALAAAYGIDEPVDMPIILGEFGAFSVAFGSRDDAAAAMARWQADSCAYPFLGWLVWMWGSESDDEVFTVNSGDDEIAVALSPQTRPDPCDVGPYVSPNLALNRPATASLEELGETEDYLAANAVDGSEATWWTAPDGPPQWIEIDLEEPRTVGRVEILIGTVSPTGPQTHQVYVRSADEPAPGRLVGEVSADATRGQVLVVELEPAPDDVRFVRVQTVQMDGWVILHEVAVYAPE